MINKEMDKQDDKLVKMILQKFTTSLFSCWLKSNTVISLRVQSRTASIFDNNNHHFIAFIFLNLLPLDNDALHKDATLTTYILSFLAVYNFN